MNARGRFGIALGTGAALMTALGVAVALGYHPVRPRIVCAMPLGTGGYAVYFGYTNEAAEVFVEPRGPSNRVEPAGEPVTSFAPGSSGTYPEAAFVVTTKTANAAWTLGPRTARLDAETARCPIQDITPPPRDVTLVLPKPPELPTPVKVEPKLEPPPLAEAPKPKLEDPKPRPIPKRLVDAVAKPEAPKPVPLALSALGKIDNGGIAVQIGEDAFGDAALDVDPTEKRVEIGGVVGGTSNQPGPATPPPEPKRVAAKVKVRPKGEWPADAPPRAGAVLVRLSLRVGTDGTVKEARVVRSAGPAFDREARAVGLRAVFAPATLDAVPVESWVPWDVEFTPDDF